MDNLNTNNQASNHFADSIDVRKRGWLRRLFAFIGPAYLVSVGYMDPGNWATDIEGGARFGYTLIWVLLMSNLMAFLLQTLAARLGVVTGLDLAQGCRREYPRHFNIFLWLLAEIAIAATDLAEALGTIIGLNLLFGLPLLWGCLVTAGDTFLFLILLRLGVRKMEAFIVTLVAVIGGCFIFEVFLAKPEWSGIAAGFKPSLNSQSLYIAVGIIGATVMPHNLYLHSCLVQSRRISKTFIGRVQACSFNFMDSMVALNLAFFVNAAILIMAAANFYSRGIEVTQIQQAHSLLDTILGSKIAPIAFAIALIASGQSSTLTSTISGQIVMEGFLNIKVRPWLRRMLTRGIALVPAIIVIAIAGDAGTYRLLIFSQVVLSLQLPFAVIPLIHFTSDKKKMCTFANNLFVKIAVWIVAAIIVALNLKLVYDELMVWCGTSPWLWVVLAPLVLLLVGALGFITFLPLFRKGIAWTTADGEAGERLAKQIRPMVIKHIGVALEHTDGDAKIISAAITLATSHDASITLVHIVDTPGVTVYGNESESLHSTNDQAYLERLAEEIAERDFKVNTDLRFGRPVEELVKSVKANGFDLLVLGSHGHRLMGDIIYGETVDSVRHAINIPVFVVRTHNQEHPQSESN
ncbi:MAG: Nramp family divalent metal transporter [Sedimentisphaerales bacterium]|jgi:manganese transport protein